MENTEIIQELKDVLVKMEGAENLLKDGKFWLSVNKIDGIKNKIRILLGKIINENHNQQKIE